VVADPASDNTPADLLLVLHGHDATEDDVGPLASELDPRRGFLVATARGPVAVDEGRFAWFEAGPRGVDLGSLRTTVTALHATIDGLCAAHGSERTRVVVAGFSQGGAAALALGLMDVGRPRPRGVICIGGYLPDLDDAFDWAGAAGTPMLVAHGTEDEVVPFDMGADSAAVLQMNAVPVVFCRYPIGHETSAALLSDARAWLERVRAGEAPDEPVTR
jgi:phospholipase/carboxylesterase